MRRIKDRDQERQREKGDRKRVTWGTGRIRDHQGQQLSFLSGFQLLGLSIYITEKKRLNKHSNTLIHSVVEILSHAIMLRLAYLALDKLVEQLKKIATKKCKLKEST